MLQKLSGFQLGVKVNLMLLCFFFLSILLLTIGLKSCATHSTTHKLCKYITDIVNSGRTQEFNATLGYRGKKYTRLKKTTSGKSNNEQTNLQSLTFQVTAD